MTSWDRFLTRLRKRYPDVIVQAEPKIGSTNSARFLFGGMKVGIPNLRSRAKLLEAQRLNKPWAYVGKLLLPAIHDSELYVALLFQGDSLERLIERLHEIEAPFGDSPPTNNTRLVLHRTGFYVHILGETEAVDPEAEPVGYGPPVDVDEILYADVDRSGQLTPAEIDIIHRMKENFSQPLRIVRLEDDGSTVLPVPQPEELSFDELSRRVHELGGFYSTDTLQTLHLNLIHHPSKHFVILRGISGTGKSRLAKCYAYAVLGADSLSESKDRFVVVPVEPHWTDPTYLLGHEDILAESGYRRTPFLDALLLADSDPLQPVFVLLDEMNRAQVEHYFSNILSAMELEGELRFHAGDSPELSAVPPAIGWPSNLYMVGTINDDESVVPFSAMVLDRANSQDLSHVDVASYSRWLRQSEPELAGSLTEEVVEDLTAISEILMPLHMHFGNRTVREIALYLNSAEKMGASINALDRQIDQKILPKLKGGEETGSALEHLAAVFAKYPASKARVEQMKGDLGAVDFFKYR